MLIQLAEKELKNLSTIFDSNTNTESLELYSDFLENVQSLDILNKRYWKKMEKARNKFGRVEAIGNHKNELSENRQKNNDIMGYLKPKEKNLVENTCFFDERVFKEDEISNFKKFSCENATLIKQEESERNISIISIDEESLV